MRRKLECLHCLQMDQDGDKLELSDIPDEDCVWHGFTLSGEELRVETPLDHLDTCRWTFETNLAILTMHECILFFLGQLGYLDDLLGYAAICCWFLQSCVAKHIDVVVAECTGVSACELGTTCLSD